MFSEVINTLTSDLLMLERVMCGICQTGRSLKTESFCSPFTPARLCLMRNYLRNYNFSISVFKLSCSLLRQWLKKFNNLICHLIYFYSVLAFIQVCNRKKSDNFCCSLQPLIHSLHIHAYYSTYDTIMFVIK